MAHGKSLTLAAIPRRTRKWLHLHEVPDIKLGGDWQPQPAARAERRVTRRPGVVTLVPYVSLKRSGRVPVAGVRS